MADVTKRLADLSPERRKLLELRLRMAQTEARGPELTPRARPDGTAPLSFAQARLWVLDRMDPGGAAYNMPYALRLRGALDVAALERALDGLRARHEILRTTFSETGDAPVQVVHAPRAVPLPVEDLRALPEDAREAEVRRRVDADANTGFDLEHGPLFRTALLRVDEAEHALLLCMHHIVSDGWSMGVLTRELGELYAAFHTGRAPALPPLPLQYADFATWQREYLKGAALDRLTAFWRQALEGAPAALELPTDHVRPAAESRRGRTLRAWIPATTADRLRELAKAEGGTLFHGLLAAFRVLLARHSAQDDVVIGTPVANRTRSELAGLVGFFVNTLPLRARVSAAESFRARVRAEKDAALAAFNHQDLPFDRLVEELRLPRDAGRNPVFQAMLTLQNAAVDDVTLGGVEIAPLAPEYHTAKFDLTFDHWEEPGGAIRVESEYATDLFDAPTVERMAAHFVRLVEDAVSSPDTPVAALAGMAADERELVLDGLNRTSVDYERDASVHALFAARLAEHPDRVAVEFGDAKLTYAELDARASGLARRLRAAGAGVESRVGVAMERSADLVVAFLGILKAGAAYVPLDPSYPAERLALMVEDAGVAALVVSGAAPEALASFRGPVLTASVDERQGDTVDAEDAEALPISGDHLAYVVYTSGSTGRPKGIGIPHRAVARLVRNTNYVPFAADERIAQISNASFDAVTFEVWGALLNGGTLVVIDRDTTLDPALLAAALEQRGITAAFMTTALFNRVARAAPRGVRGMRHLLFGGEASDPAAVRALLAAGGPERLLNAYGPTESTTFATWHVVETVPADAVTVPIGLPLANTTAYVVDGDGRACGLGEPGELLLGGDGLARGYLGRPGLTAAAFVPDPFGGAAGARLYRSGDRVRRRDDGSIEFLARVDQQVKVRGFRIEPGEVEAALRELPDVGDCAVIVRTDAAEKRLVAYVVPANGTAPAPTRLRDALASRLPAYMVPQAFVALPAIPLTPNGKVDRRALPAPEAPAGDPQSAPRTPAEELVAQIWAAVLGVPRVGIDDDFFMLGGHSLLATQVVSRLRRAFGAEVPLRAVFEAPTVRALAERVTALRGGPEPLPPVEPVDRSEPLPLSFSQKRLWFMERLEPTAGLYNMPVRLRLRGPLDPSALRRALELVVHRHEALRTRIREVDGEPLQQAAPPERLDLPVIDVPDEIEGRRVLDEEAWRPFDLRDGPVFRALLVRISPAEHVLGVNVHHALSDGWTLGIIWRELEAAYRAFVRGQAPHLPPVPLQFGDYAVWQRRHLAGERLEAESRYWRQALEGAPPLLELPTDRPRRPHQSFRGSHVPLRLPPETVRALHELAAREGATPFMAMLAAFQALLGRLSNQQDVVVGTPVAGRSRAETEGVAGLFVNTLALRADLGGRPTFRELLRRVRESTLGAFAHQDLPFEKVVELLNVERSLSHSPLFQAVFAFNSTDSAAPRLDGIDAQYELSGVELAKFDLTLTVEAADDGGMDGGLEYAVDLFDQSTAERIATRWRLLLEGVLAHPDRPVASIEALAPGEREQLAAWADGGPGAEPVPCHHLFREWVRRTPDAPAVAFGSREVSYGELDRMSSRLARHLQTLGVRHESVVAISLDRGIDQLAAVLAVWKAGGAYLPIDPAYPPERRSYMLSDSGAQVLLTRAALSAEVDTAGARVETMDQAWAAAAGLDDSDPDLPADVWQVAYVIYTSGSTGRPKGVMVAHAGLHNLAEAMRRAYDLRPGTRILQFASFSFDVAASDVVSSVANGCTLVMAPQEALLPGKPLLATLQAQRIECSLIPPSVWAVLPDAELPDLRTASTGGEACTPEVVARWAPGRRMVNAYGPTEATVVLTLGTLRPGEKVMLGTSLMGMRLYVLDTHGELAAIGTPGEICGGGIGVARGYLGRPALTAERFVPDPYAGIPGARMYRTGDLGRWGAGGEVEYLGRMDHQVKVRGMRVEPGEIEAALVGVDGVRDALVLVRPSPAGDQRLVAYVVGEPTRTPTVASMRASLRQVMPEHMVPAEFVILPAFPMTVNGKVDRRALPAPAWGGTHARELARTPTEEVIAAVWQEVLGITEVGRGDDFFALGGHSLLATRVVARIRRALEVDLPLRDVFDASTLEALAARVDAERGRAGGVPQQPIPIASRDGELPLSFAQERLWFVQRLRPKSTAYNMPLALRLRGVLDVDSLRRALDEVVRRHEALRTVFRAGSRGPVQVVLPASPVPLPFIDLANRSDADAEAARIADEDARTPFDLEAGPLLRCMLVKRGAEDHTLLLSLHHIVGDGWSMERFHAELGALYAAFVAGEPSPLPELPLQYADFAVWQRDWLRGPVLTAQLSYWRNRLAGAPTLQLPTDRPRPADLGLRGGCHDFTLPRELGDRVEEVGRQEGATPFMAMLAAFCALLHRWSGDEDMVVGTVVAGRGRHEVEDLIGFFVNTLPLRADVSGDPTYRELVRRVRQTTLEAYAHQDLPFEKLVDELKVERSLNRHPILQVSFSLATEAPVTETPGLAMEPGEGGDTGTAKLDLMLGVVNAPDGLRCSLEYSADLFDGATMERAAARWAALLQAAAASPDARLSDLLAEVDAADRHLVVDEWNRTDAPLPQLPVHAQFAEQAARTPDAPAVSLDGRTLTYAELDAAANRLAHHLREMGVGPESRVGVVVDRTPEMVMAVLATLKAGGAYVPLDPAYPAERLRHMLDDSDVRVLVTPSSEWLDSLPDTDARVVAMDRDAEAIAAHASTDPAVAVDAAGLAYVIYTSGSTGTPKGVLVQHGGVANLVRSQVRRWEIGAGSRVLQFASLSFDAAVSELFTALTTGATLVLAPRDAVLPGPPLVDLLRSERITKVTLPPSVLAALPDADLPELRSIVSAGEAVGPAIIERWAPGRDFHNAYGPTENTVGASSGPCTADGGVPDIGRPFDNVRCYVLDEAMRPVAVGVPGELYLGGAGVARGYHHQPALTAQAFVPDPFGPAPGARLYCTGDRARWLADGRLQFLGRTDAQLKVRGYRIEPGEIVALLTGVEGVADAVVEARGEGGARLVAYVVPAPGAAVDTEALRAHLRQRLPEYMVPSAMVVMDELPLTPNGKVDRAALPEPAPQSVEAEGDAAPQGELERTVAGVWRELLNAPAVSVNDNFFEIGGHSLLLAQLHTKLEAALGREFPMLDLFRHPTVRAFAASLSGEPPAPEAQPTGAKRGEDRGSARRAAFVRRGR